MVRFQYLVVAGSVEKHRTLDFALPATAER
jgi:hypothetical protein